MDEIEARLAAIETALIEVLAELDPVALAKAKRRLVEGIEIGADGQATSGDETTIRFAAAGLIEQAERRFERFGLGGVQRPHL